MFVVSEPQRRPTFIKYDSAAHAFHRILPGVSGWLLDYSRDGKWVAFIGNDGRGLFVRRANGTEPRQLSPELDPGALPRWSPDGKRIAYTVQHPDRPWRIYVVDLETGTAHEASEGSDSQGAPTWSPDGRSLVYGNVDCGYTRNCGIHIIDLATGKVKSLPDSTGLSTARWSPNGRMISAQNVEQHQLKVFDVRHGKWHTLADRIDGMDLSWSADSKYVYANVGGQSAQIVRIRVSDGRRETVLDFSSQDKFDLAESDDLQFSLAPDASVILHRSLHSQEIYAYEVKER